ncbi:hypothetical protein NDU88_004236 [Pleurodeles waltl]|uniref:Uncharacterized protein n=1 Tax=Pleurodeles waltl TaxID=8319 RepID=A0AAV7LKS3_PLEWA|nr:hypothetical protein NDU88_004236 [Pleurodeles waltl]
MCPLSNQALLSVQSLKLPVRLGTNNMRLHDGQLLQGCIRSASSSPPAAVASLRTCTQGSAVMTAGPLGPLLGPRPRLRLGPEQAVASVGKATIMKLAFVLPFKSACKRRSPVVSQVLDYQKLVHKTK